MPDSAGGTLVATLGCAAVCAAAGPYLAGLARTAAETANAQWWRPVRAERRDAFTAGGVGAVLGALAGAAAGWTAALPAFVVLALAGTPLVLIDVAQHRLPARLVHPLAAAAAVLFTVAAFATSRWTDLLRVGLAALVVGAALYLLHRISPPSFGRGDVRLGAVLGGYLGWTSWPAVLDGVFAGFLLGALAAIVLVLARRATMKSAVPFGPALVLGALIVLSLDLVPVAGA